MPTTIVHRASGFGVDGGLARLASGGRHVCVTPFAPIAIERLLCALDVSSFMVRLVCMY